MHETIRAGAFLRVEVWDWDRGTTDEPLGSFEVKVGEELLSQQVKLPWRDETKFLGQVYIGMGSKNRWDETS